jgi:hypothetical protein
MTTENNSTPFIQSLFPAMKWAERIATAAFIASLAAVLLTEATQMDIARNVFMISSAILAGTYFLYAFMPLDFKRDENEQFGMMDLVTMMIAPKVLWISCAVSMLGFFTLSQNLETSGHLQLFLIGGISVTSSLLLLAFAIVSGNKNASVIAPVAFRAVPILALVIFFYLND